MPRNMIDNQLAISIVNWIITKVKKDWIGQW
jgi:hypothetical protein